MTVIGSVSQISSTQHSTLGSLLFVFTSLRFRALRAFVLLPLQRCRSNSSFSLQKLANICGPWVQVAHEWPGQKWTSVTGAQNPAEVQFLSKFCRWSTKLHSACLTSDTSECHIVNIYKYAIYTIHSKWHIIFYCYGLVTAHCCITSF